MPDPTWKVGDDVIITYQGRVTYGIIAMASDNQNSLMLEFDGLLGPHGGCLPAFRDKIGLYRSVLTNKPVFLCPLIPS